MVFRDSAGIPAYALSVITDVTMWRAVHALAESMLPAAPARPRGESESGEHYANDVDALGRHLLTSAIAGAGAPTDLMQKRHKLAVVSDLKRRGFFMLRDSIEDAASALGAPASRSTTT